MNMSLDVSIKPNIIAHRGPPKTVKNNTVLAWAKIIRKHLCYVLNERESCSTLTRDTRREDL